MFGSLLTFALAHLAIIMLRIRKPELPRPFKLPGKIKIAGKEIPIISLLGLISTFSIWVVVIILEPFSRWAGIIWMSLGLMLYFIYKGVRRRKKEEEQFGVYKHKE